MMLKREVTNSILGMDFDPSTLITRSFSVHGLSLNVTSDSTFILNPITKFLEYFFLPEVIEETEIQFYLMKYPLSKFHLLPIIQREGRLLFDSEKEDQLRISQKLGINLKYLSWERFYVADFGSKGVLLLSILEGIGVGFFPDPSSIHPGILSNFIFLTGLSEMLRSRGLFPVHGAALAREDTGILVPGFTRSGKTTLSIALVRKGFKFLSDDRSLFRKIKSGFELLAFPEGVDVTDDTLSFFPEIQELPDDFFEMGLTKRRFWVEKVYPNSISHRCLPRILLFPNIVGRKVSRLKPITRMEAVERFLPHTLLVFDQQIAEKQFYLLCQLVEEMDCYRLDFGKDLLSVSELIEEIV
jgi:hypothetical protein